MPRTSRRPARALAIVALVGSLPLGGLWLGGQALAQRTARSEAPPVSQLVTPLLSTRRAATTLANDISVQALTAKLGTLVAKMPSQGCLRVQFEGRPVVSQRATDLFEPASTVKIATASVVTELLPPETVFTTRIYGQLTGGNVEGNLVIKGGGDPLLVTSDYARIEKYPTTNPTSLDALADKIVAAGVKTVAGAVAGDESYFSDQRYVPSWSSGIRGVEGGPLGALMVNDGVIVSNPVKPNNPSQAAASELTRLLRARGVTVNGEPLGSVTVAAGTPEITSIASAPVAKAVGEMLTNSDNNTAEILVRHLGLLKGTAGTTEAGVKVMNDTLASWGFEGVLAKDGSGLSRGSKFSCDALVGLLARNGPTGSVGEGLATAGTTGTLKEVFVGSPVQGLLKAKTGTLTNVKALSGFLPVKNHQPLYFALILNGAGLADQGNYRPLWESLGKALVTFPSTPTSQGLGVR